MRILVVEDEEENASVIRDLLLEGGHVPIVAPSVDAALARFETTPPDAVLLNLYFYFPGVSGLNFLRQRLGRWADIPVIAVSGFPTESQARECFRLGVLDFVDKRSSCDLVRWLIAYLELRTAGRRVGDRGLASERRRSPRPSLVIPVRIAGAGGAECPGECVDLSVFGMKVRPHGPLVPDPVVKLSFVPPDETAVLEVLAVPVRGDSDGHCFRFVSLSETTFRRLTGLVQREAERQGGAPSGLDEPVAPAGVAAATRPATDLTAGPGPRRPGRAQ